MISSIFSNVNGNLTVDMQNGNVSAVQVQYQNTPAAVSLVLANIVDGMLFQLSISNRAGNSTLVRVSGVMTDEATSVGCLAIVNGNTIDLRKNGFNLAAGHTSSAICGSFAAVGDSPVIMLNVTSG